MMVSSFCECYAIPDIYHFEAWKLCAKKEVNLQQNSINQYYGVSWPCLLIGMPHFVFWLVSLVIVLVGIYIYWDGVLSVFGIWDGVFVK